MAIGNYYPVTRSVTDDDLFLGTRAGNNNTVNYMARTLVDYLNTNAKISIGGQLSFRFTIIPDVPKTIAFNGGGGNNTPFSVITQLIVSAIDLSDSNVTIFLNYLNGSEILLSQQNEPNLFGHYKITSYSVIGTSQFYTLNLQFIGGNGNIEKDLYYDVSPFVLSSGGNIPTLNQVLTAGNVSLLDAKVGELYLYDSANTDYGRITNEDTSFVAYEYTGNKTFSASSTDSEFIMINANNKSAKFNSLPLTATRTYNLPDASGTIALTSDIPVITTPTLNQVLTSGNVSLLDAKVGDLYLYDPTEFDYGYLSLNDSDFSFYDVYGQAIGMNRSTIRFSGLLGGFSGTIALPSVTANRTYTLPNASGTIALISDIPTGGTIPHATASGTDTYTATITGVTSYADADAYLIRFTNGNTTGATLNINSLGAIPLYENNNGPLIGGDIWDNGEMLCVYNSSLNIFQCIGTSANSLFSYVTNADSVAITKGQPVYAFGGTGDRLTVKRAFNTSDAGSAKTIGVVLTSSIGVNQKGIIIIQGLLDGLNILPTATWSDGDTVYLGTTAGSITNIKQYAPNHLVYLGTVTTASNGSSGRWYVRVQNGYELDELHNVQAQTPSLKDTLWYDSGVTPGQWKTASISTILGYTPFNLPSLTSGSVLFSNGTTIAQDNANFFWDDTNNRLGIGTKTPKFGLNLYLADNLYNIGTNNPYSANNNYFIGHGLDDLTPANITSKIGFISDAPIDSFSDAIVFYTTPSVSVISPSDSSIERMRITSDGFVGIGTNSPSAALHVNGSMYLQSLATGVESITFSSGPLISNDGPSGIFKSGEVYTNTINGRVGIGISAGLSDALTVNGDIKFGTGTGAVETIRSAAGGSMLSYDPIASYVNIAGFNLVIDTANSVISTYNSIGIGTSGPLTALEVVGVITATGGDSTYWNAKQDPITLTTTGTSGAATLVGATLNIPQYSGGGATGRHALIPLASGNVTNSVIISVNPLANTAFTTNRLITYPFIPNQSFTSSNLFVNVTTLAAGAFCRIAVYDDLNGYPNNRLFVSSDLDCSTTGQKTATASISFVAGTIYWLAFHGGNVSAQTSAITQAQSISLKANTINSMANSVFYSLNFTTPTPATFLAGQQFVSSALPYIGITKA